MFELFSVAFLRRWQAQSAACPCGRSQSSLPRFHQLRATVGGALVDEIERGNVLQVSAAATHKGHACCAMTSLIDANR